MISSSRDFEYLLEESTRIHGHLCPGKVLGVKMSILGLKEAVIKDPKGEDRKNIIVFVESVSIGLHDINDGLAAGHAINGKEIMPKDRTIYLSNSAPMHLFLSLLSFFLQFRRPSSGWHRFRRARS